jgi:hypothetical protein
MKECKFLQVNSDEDIIRMGAEVALEIGAVLYIVAALREARFLGYSMFIENLVSNL